MDVQTYKNVFKNLAYGSFTQESMQNGYLVSFNIPVRYFQKKQMLEQKMTILQKRIDKLSKDIKKLYDNQQYKEVDVMTSTLESWKNTLEKYQFIIPRIDEQARAICKAIDTYMNSVVNQQTLSDALTEFESMIVPQAQSELDVIERFIVD